MKNRTVIEVLNKVTPPGAAWQKPEPVRFQPNAPSGKTAVNWNKGGDFSPPRPDTADRSISSI
jgi:hypothetical protein